MHIGFDAKRAFNNQSGLGNYSRNLISALYYNYPENQYILYTPYDKKELFRISGNNLNTRFPSKKLHQIFPSYWRSFIISNEINKDKLDIYHGLSNELPVNIKRSKIKSVVTIHDLIFLRHPEMYNIADRWIYNKKFYSACRTANRIVAVSKQTADDIINFYNIKSGKIDIVYQGCNPVFFEKHDESIKNFIKQKYQLPERFILYVGTIESRKNLLNLIKAVHIGKLDIPLVAIGRKKGYYKIIEDYIYSNSINNILFNDVIENEELPAFYQLADVFVYPSFFEGFGIPVLESLASGTPVITTKGGCFSEAGGPDSLYIDPAKPEEIADALKNVLNDSRLRAKMIENGYNYAGRFTPDKISSNIMEIYEKELRK